MQNMDLVMVLSFFIATITSIIILTNYNIIKRIKISLLVQIATLLVASIATIISIFFMETVGEAIKQIFELQIIGVVQVDKIYILGCTIYIYIAPLYSYYINQKANNKFNKKQLIKYLITTTALAIILITVILLVVYATGDKYGILEHMDIYKQF